MYNKKEIAENVFLFENFLTEEEVKIFYNIAILSDSSMWIVETDDWYKNRLLRIPDYTNLLNKYKSNIIEIENRYKELFYKEINSTEFNFIDNRTIYKADVGDLMPPHYDLGGNSLVRYGIVIYINDNYEGGEIYYPKLKVSLKPKSGSIIFHPSTIKYTHGVKPVVSGTRYSMANFIAEKVG